MRNCKQLNRYLRTAGLLAAFLILMTFSTALASDKVEVEYSFDRPQTVDATVEGEFYTRLVMPETPNCGNPGEPALPAMGAKILLPYGTEVESIEIIPGDRIGLGDGYKIVPVAPQTRLSANPAEMKLPVPDLVIYNSDQLFPGNLHEEMGVQSFRGYQMLIIKLQPVQYIPLTGEVYYYSDLKVVVNTINTGISDPLFRGLMEDEDDIMAKVDNPDMARSYNAAPRAGAKNYDLLIITTSTLAPSFQPLKDYHDTTGILTEIHTTLDVGSTNPDAVRDYIYQRYINDGISYVIIGADDDIIPAKDLYVSTGGAGADIEYNMPGDIYFACLNGTWNNDGDSYWGEPTDGLMGGDVDLVAEVYLGRASVGDATEATRFVNKTIQYITIADEYLQNVVMVGEYLGFGGEAQYAGLAMERIIDSCDAYGYFTIGIPSNQYNIDELFDRDWAGNDWPKSELITRINNGAHIVNHLGHGSPDYAMKLYNSDILSSLTNTEHCFVYSQTCLAGHFDGTECWAETMNIKTDYGGFAVIMNARYGFGEYNSTDGASQRFNREFWDAVFNPLENKNRLGPANHDSKEDNLYRVNEECMRWCYYELNLFGDPTVSIRESRAIAFEYPGGVPATVLPGQPTSFEVVVNGVGEGVPSPGSGQLHYSLDGGIYQTIAMAELLDNHYTATLPPADCDSWYDFYISADETMFGTFYNPDTTEPFYALVATEIIVSFEDDFETDQGWTTSSTATSGQWERGTPVGGGDRGDPANDFDGSGQCYLTGNTDGDSDIDGGTVTLVSPLFDLSSGDGEIHYARWYSNDYGAAPLTDSMLIYISNDNGINWTLAEVVGPTGPEAQGGWYEHSFNAGEFVTPTNQMKLRFVAGDLGSGSVVEAAIDDVWVKVYECFSGLAITTDSLPDWTVDRPYSQVMEHLGGSGTVTWMDKYGDLVGTGLALSSDGVISGTPLAAGPISFTAYIADEGTLTDEKPFEFTINPDIEITSESLPDWTAGIEYSQQLQATGGTAPSSWIDKDNDLDGTGLSLTPEGLLAGTPATSGGLTFTAQVVDAAGATDLQVLTFTINAAVDITTTLIPSWTVGMPYSHQLHCNGGTGQIVWTDKNLDLEGSGLTLSSAGLLSGTPGSTGQKLFTARAVDQLASFDEQAFNFTINPAVDITTTALPGGEQSTAYSAQLECTGGTVPLTWSDKNADLEGTGLVLSASGNITGTPGVYGDISFTAQVTCMAGSSDEEVYSFNIEQNYLCGDASGDEDVNVSDAVSIINYIFAGGNPPDPFEAGDVNCDGEVNVSDSVYIINYVFTGGFNPCDPDGNGIPDC
jgi:hypothetical protein